MDFLSIMSKGTTQEKVLWSFDFLDIDGNGYIEKQEMTKESSPFIIQTLSKKTRKNILTSILAFFLKLYHITSGCGSSV